MKAVVVGRNIGAHVGFKVVGDDAGELVAPGARVGVDGAAGVGLVGASIGLDVDGAAGVGLVGVRVGLDVDGAARVGLKRSMIATIVIATTVLVRGRGLPGAHPESYTRDLIPELGVLT